MQCPCCQGPECETTTPRRKRRSLLGTLFQVVLVYAMLVFGGGTLINSGHPVAVEVGRLLHLVTFVDPAIHWASDSGLDTLASGLELAAGGYPIG